MFTDVWDDNRTPQQKAQDDEREQRLPHQRALFADEALEPPADSQPDPTPVPLISPPERSNERAEGPDSSSFGDWASLVDDIEEEQAAEFAAAPEPLPPRSQEEVYRKLIQLAQDVAETTWIDPRYEARYQIQLRVVVLEARAAGLSDVEIDLAFVIGETRGRQAREQNC